MDKQDTTSNGTPWYQQWFDENYLLLYRHRNMSDAQRQTRLILETLDLPDTVSIMDLCCGEGRYTVLLKDRGYRITGLDISETLIDSGRKKYPHLDLRLGDMREIPGTYDLILSLFTSFGYFDTDEENESVVKAVYNALNPGGVYWLDFLNAAQVENHLVPHSIMEPEPGITAEATRKIEKGRIIKDILFKKDGTQKTYRESVRLFTRNQLEAMFHRAGFSPLHIFGDYDGAPWTPESPRTIVVGKRRK